MGFEGFDNAELLEAEKEFVDDRDQLNVELKSCKDWQREGVEMAYSEVCRDLSDVRREMLRRGISNKES